MKITELQTTGFRVPDGVYSFRDGDGPSSVVVVTGPAGAGKTMLLRLLAAAKEAFAPYGAPTDLRKLLRPGETTGRITLTLSLGDAEAAHAKALSGEQSLVIEVEPSGEACSGAPSLKELLSGANEAAAGWELFPAHRRLGTEEWDIPHPPLSDAIEQSRRLGPDGDKYIALRRVLHDVALAEATGVSRALGEQGVALRGDGPDGLAPYREAVAAMLPDLRLVSVDLGAKSASPVFQRSSGERVSIGELSASEEQGVLVAFAFAWRGLRGGVVFVDSPELHVAPSGQAAFVDRLVALGKGAQVFFATGSPEVAATPGARVIKLDRMSGARA